MTVAVTVDGLSYAYGDQRVLDDISLTVDEGAFVGLIGPNGSGKTTLVKHVLGLLEPDAGAVQVFGHDPVTARDRQLVGYVPQQYNRDPQFPATVRELLDTAPVADAPHIDRDALLDRFDLQTVLDDQFVALSGGQQQKVMAALALLQQPRLLILDEPSVGVDVQAQQEFYRFLEDLNAEHGMTVILVSHDIGAIAQQTEEAIFLNRSICCQAETDELPTVLEEAYGDEYRHFTHEGHDHV